MFWSVPGSTRSRPLWAQIGCAGLDMFLECQISGNQSIYWKPAHGKRSRGRPRRNCEKYVLEDTAIFREKQTSNWIRQKGWPNIVRLREMIRRLKREFLGAGPSNDCGDLIKYKKYSSFLVPGLIEDVPNS